ncbi:MAG: hypothetical protein GY724_09580 [Actinomycetia bacterium]|nr:hypothetical protein [Actinomycetes bacterium]MCP4227479.1 hypothetical protein [Actinomycetes bacterium]MCP5033736.1 hypothetical protein [Actinomycetes bacterium]
MRGSPDHANALLGSAAAVTGFFSIVLATTSVLMIRHLRAGNRAGATGVLGCRARRSTDDLHPGPTAPDPTLRQNLIRSLGRWASTELVRLW